MTSSETLPVDAVLQQTLREGRINLAEPVGGASASPHRCYRLADARLPAFTALSCA